MSLTFPFMIRRVQGHSMVPVLPPGTVVYGWRWFRKLKPQKVIIFTREGRETIKRIDRVDSSGIYVLGDHPETSTDSRHYGTIAPDIVTGVIIWPHTKKVMAETIQSAREELTRPKDI